MQTISILTKEDLQEFKSELLNAIQELCSTNGRNQNAWLKSSEVQKLLKISAGTLQNYRINGTLPFKKIGGTLYYKYESIEKLLEDSK